MSQAGCNLSRVSLQLRHDEAADVMLACPICDRGFGSVQGLNKHRSRAHRDEWVAHCRQVMIQSLVVPYDEYPGASTPWPSQCVQCLRDVAPRYADVARGPRCLSVLCWEGCASGGPAHVARWTGPRFAKKKGGPIGRRARSRVVLEAGPACPTRLP